MGADTPMLTRVRIHWRRHDHTNTTAYAIDRHGHPVPGWWFTCPKCGTQDAQHFAEQEWTKHGIAWMRAQAQAS